MSDLPRQLGESHTPAGQKWSVGLHFCPGGAEVANAQHALIQQARYAQASYQFWMRRPPGLLGGPVGTDPAANARPPICIHGRLETVIGELILSADPTPDRLGHTPRRAAVEASRNSDPDRRIMTDPGINPRQGVDECTILSGRDRRNRSVAPMWTGHRDTP